MTKGAWDDSSRLSSAYPVQGPISVMRRTTTSPVVLGLILAALIPVRPIAAETGCANGTREALTDPQEFPDIAACAGKWSGPVSNAHGLCAHGWNVCSSNFDIAKLRRITFDDAVAVSGCFAFNAAQDNFSCIPCTGEPLAREMGGIGAGCQAHERSSDDSCITGGRIDVLLPSEVSTANACQFREDVTTGVLCCVSQCGNGILDPGEQCDDGNLDAGDCCSATCQFEDEGTQCRPTAGECDPAETCTGSSGECPDDAKSPSGTACSDDGNPCTTDLCDGIHAVCVHAPGNVGKVCRPSAGMCDPEETCTGQASRCPDDVKSPQGTMCGQAANGLCEVAALCTGNGPDCPTVEATPGAKYDEALLSGSCAVDAVDAIATRVDCVRGKSNVFGSCVQNCPGFAGRCAITRDCLNKCRDELTLDRAECISSFTSGIRKRDGGRQCLAAARQARRQFRRCLHGAGAPTRKETSGTDAAEVAGARPSLSLTDSCQGGCVLGIVGSCYDDCRDQCEGDRQALGICRQACKDAQCGELHTVCKCEPGLDCKGS